VKDVQEVVREILRRIRALSNTTRSRTKRGEMRRSSNSEK